MIMEITDDKRKSQIWKNMYHLFDNVKTIMDEKLEEKEFDFSKISFGDIASIKDYLNDNLNLIFSNKWIK